RGEFVVKLVSRGTAFQAHLRGPDLGGQLLVLERSAAGDPGAGCQKQLQRPLVALPAGKPAVAMGVGVDEARMNQQPGRIDDVRAFWNRKGCADLFDNPVLDQNVALDAATGAGVGDEGVADQHVSRIVLCHSTGPSLRWSCLPDCSTTARAGVR